MIDAIEFHLILILRLKASKKFINLTFKLGIVFQDNWLYNFYIKDIGEKGIEETLLLVKDHDKEIRKERGSLLIEAYINSSYQGVSPVQARRNQEALLVKLIYHSIKSESNNNKVSKKKNFF